MTSFMLDRFAAYGLLCRLGGCFYIQHFSKKSLLKAKVSWKNLYTLYSASCLILSLGFFIGFQAFLFIREHNKSPGQSDQFADTLALTQDAVVFSKLFVNFLSMVTGSGELLEFLRKSVIFEKSTAFVSSKCGVQGRRWFHLRTLLVSAALATSYVTLMLFYVVHFANTMPPEWAIGFKVIGPLAGLFVYLYDSLCYVVVRSCAGVLLEYVRAQLTAFEDCSQSNGFRYGCQASQASGQLAAIRLNLCRIRDLIRSLNTTWKVSLAGTGAGVILMNCSVFYSVFHEGIFQRKAWISLPYCAYTSLAFLELVYISQALMDETQKLKIATKAIRTSDLSEGYVQELRYLHDSIDPKSMCLNGDGFFRLTKSLLVSMTGSVITYTVILVQTSDELISKIDVIKAP